MSVNNKIVLILISIFSCIGIMMLLGCSVDVTTLTKENVSEKTELYFTGVGEFKASLSSGEREDPFIYDGIKNACVDYSVVTLYVSSSAQSITAEVFINGIGEIKIFDFDIISGNYVADLEKKVKQEDEIKIKYRDQEVILNCVSKNFVIDANKALEIGIDSFKGEMEKLLSKNKLTAECYLRILDRAENNFSLVYWYFYIYAKNGTTYSCVITVDDGKIIVRN